VKQSKAVELSSPSTVAWWSNPGVIYFIAAGEPPVAIKIGNGRDHRQARFDGDNRAAVVPDSVI
jgi:hypothetical protein